mgnify:CR=1 FL=1
MDEEKKENEAVSENPEPTASYSKKSRKSLISGLILLIAFTIVVIIVLLSLGEIQAISDTFASLWKKENYGDLIIALSLTLFYFLTYPLPLTILNKAMGTGVDFFDAYLIGSSELFYNFVTPAAAGGQPFQIYSYTRKNVSTSKGTGLILLNFSIYLFAISLFYAGSLFFFPNMTAYLEPNWLKWVALVAVLFNIAFFFFVAALAFSKRMSNFLVGVLRWLCKAKWINKFLGNKIPSFEEYCANTQQSARDLIAHRKSAFFSFLIRLINLIAYFAIPFFLIRAVGYKIDYVYLPFVGLATAFISASVSWVPTPGSTWAADYAFSLILASVLAFATQGEISPSGISGEALSLSLLWRMCTYYLMLLLSGMTNLIFEARCRKKSR